ncbi:MAG: LacI family transcriptional regulator [Bifidobacteriaceae bacterium]|nr:LacI family transcriptional regulator [Bifidobacteriaceae bacterium]
MTQKGLARELGVSRSLVSMALADSPSVADQTKERVKAAAARLGYVRDLGAAALAGGGSAIAAVLLPDLRNPFFEGLVDSIERYAAARGLLAVVATAANDPPRERQTVAGLQRLRPAGLIAVSPAATVATLREYARDLPTAVIGVQAVGGQVDVAHVDEAAAAALIAGRALAWGATRLAQLAPSAAGRDNAVAFRRAAARRAAGDAGLEYLELESVPEAVALARGGPGRNLAIAAHNDFTAVNLVAALRASGIAPGRAVGVIGFDDTYLARLPEFSLTSVDQGAEALGAAAVEFVTSRLEAPGAPGRELVAPPSLSVRDSG